MTFDIHELKHIRRKIGVTQVDLAKKSGVSQSLIAKIESGKLDPTYSKAQQIIQAVQFLSGQREPTAADIMQPRIISVKSTTFVKEVVKKLKQHDISQMPVIDDNKIVGLVTESSLLNSLLDGQQHTQVEETMAEAPPTISGSAGASVVSDLLKHFPLVMIAEKGKLLGVVTKADVIQKLYR